MYSFYDGQVLKTLGKDTKRTTGPGYYGERVDDAEEFIERNKDNHNLAWLIPDGRFILDVDNHKGSVGSESLGRLKEDYDLPLIKSVTTAGGGEHYYCRLPDLFTGKLMHKIPGYPGLELLREGQTVVIPPSKIGRKKYTLHSTTLNELPQEILDKCTKAEFIDDGEEVPEEQREAVLSYVRRLIPYVSIEDYMDWWGVGNALKSLGDKAFPLFHDWSRTQVGYVDRNDCKEHWVKEMKEEGSYKFIEFLAWNRVCEKLINNIHTFVEIDGNKKNVDWDEAGKYIKPMTYFHNAYERTYYKDGQSLRRPTPWVFEQIVKGTLVRTMRAMVQYTPTLEELKYYKANELDKLIYKVKNSNLLWNRKINERMKSNQVNLSRMRCYVGNTETNAWEAWKQSKKECSSVDGLTFCPKLYDGESGGIGELLQIGGGRYIQTFNPESIPKPWEGEYTEKGLRLIHAFESLIYAWAESEKDAETLMWFFAAQIRHMGEKLGVAAFITSEIGGTGKSVIVNIVRSCLGWDNTLCQPTPRLEERFQAKFEESSFVIFEELEFRGKNREKLMEPMKDLITNEGKKQKQYKGVDFIGIREFFNVCITSNHKDALKLNTKTVRRVFPLQILPSSNQQHPELCNRLEKELKKRGQSMNARTIRDWFIQELVPYSKENSPQNEIRQLRDYLMNLPGAQDVEKVKSRLVEQTQNEAAQRATKEELARRETAETTDMLIEMGIPLVNKHFVSEGALMKELWNHHPHLRGSKELSSHTVRNDLQERGYTRFHEIRGIKVPLDEYNFTIKNEQSRNEAFEKYKGECVVRKKTIRVQASSNTNFSESKWRDDINEYNGRGGYGFLVIGADKVEDKPTDKVEDKPTDKVEDKPTDKVEDKPTDKVEDKPTDKVEDKPTDKVEDKPTDKVEDKPTDKYAKKRKRKTQPTEKITVLPLSRDKEMDKELDSNPTLR